MVRAPSLKPAPRIARAASAARAASPCMSGSKINCPEAVAPAASVASAEEEEGARPGTSSEAWMAA